MNLFCLFSSITSNELAAWVQALGTIVALAIAIWQSNKQFKNSLRLIEYEKSVEKLEYIKTILEILRAIHLSTQHAISMVNDLDSLHAACNDEDYPFLDDLKHDFDMLTKIPLHSLPYKFIGFVSNINFVNRYILESFAKAMKSSLALDEAEFSRFLNEVTSLNEEQLATIDDFQVEAITYAQQINT